MLFFVNIVINSDWKTTLLLKWPLFWGNMLVLGGV